MTVSYLHEKYLSIGEELRKNAIAKPNGVTFFEPSKSNNALSSSLHKPIPSFAYSHDEVISANNRTKGKNFFNQKSTSPFKANDYYTQRSTSLNARNKPQQVVKLPALYSPDIKKITPNENSPTQFSLESNARIDPKNSYNSPKLKITVKAKSSKQLDIRNEDPIRILPSRQKSSNLNPAKLVKDNSSKEDANMTPKSPPVRRLTLVDDEIKILSSEKNDTLFTGGNLFKKQLPSGTSVNSAMNATSHSSPPYKINSGGYDRNFNDSPSPKQVKGSLPINFGSQSQPGRNEDATFKINQDTVFICKNIFHLENFRIFGVLDGHGLNGHLASRAVSTFFSEYFKNESNYPGLPLQRHMIETERFIYDKLRENNYEMIKTCFNKAESSLKAGKFDVNFSGTTSVAIIQIGDMILCANVGDSRAIIVSETAKKKKAWPEFENYTVEALSIDHKPDLEVERKRIASAGGRIEQYSGK